MSFSQNIHWCWNARLHCCCDVLFSCFNLLALHLVPVLLNLVEWWLRGSNEHKTVIEHGDESHVALIEGNVLIIIQRGKEVTKRPNFAIVGQQETVVDSARDGLNLLNLLESITIYLFKLESVVIMFESALEASIGTTRIKIAIFGHHQNVILSSIQVCNCSREWICDASGCENAFSTMSSNATSFGIESTRIEIVARCENIGGETLGHNVSNLLAL
mmetsp:Transcript_5352/g.19995  ORF Transcript_5352/g.19995 Transcript_5352/m.19995 type:complete len:217 (-) Transcript_5352:791-1441(-)